MVSLKPLKSIAHNLAHHFSSTLSMWKTDYTINHLGIASKTYNAPKIEINVLENSIKPEILNQGIIQEFLPEYQTYLTYLLKTHSMENVALKDVIIKYDFDVGRSCSYNLPTYSCISTIRTVSGRQFQATLTETS